MTVSPAGSSARSGSGLRSGLALIRKPEGITSFQALAPLKRRLGSGKVGHAGTLDRFASGLIVALAENYSRLASYVQRGEKRYRGLVAFGKETATLDPEGETIATAPPPSLAELESALPQFRGPIMQKPPAYSAVHVDGKRAYELARKGAEPGLKERPVEIFSLKLVSYEAGSALLDVRCSSGTYIRALARDLALACDSRAHLAALERLSIGPYSLGDAVSPEDFDPDRDLRAFSAADASGLGLRTLELREPRDAARFALGGRIPAGAFRPLDGGADPIGADSAVFGSSGSLLGLARLEAGGIAYLMVMAGEGKGAA